MECTRTADSSSELSDGQSMPCSRFELFRSSDVLGNVHNVAMRMRGTQVDHNTIICSSIKGGIGLQFYFDEVKSAECYVLLAVPR